jgi:hypothetical protein
MWFLPTFGRPGRCQGTLDSVIAAGTSTPGVVIINGDPDPRHRSLRLPDGWKTIYLEPPNIGLCHALSEAFERFPDLEWYGYFADENIVRTPGWDAKLVEAAGSNRIANPDYGWQASERLHGAVVFGGDLLRAWGWWVPPGLIHSFLDDAWEHIATKLGIWHHVPEVMVEHCHVGNDKAPDDATYTKGCASFDADKAAFHNLMQREIPEAIVRAIPVTVSDDEKRRREARAK